MNQRQDFRIKYPQTDRPQAQIESAILEILDLSVSGLRIKSPDAAEFKPGSNINFIILFKSAGKYKARGNVVRVLQDLVMVALDKKIPRSIMQKEAQRLIDTYGSVETTRFVDQKAKFIKG